MATQQEHAAELRKVSDQLTKVSGETSATLQKVADLEADAVRGRNVTSWPSLKTDLVNAGARWVDQDVATDNGLVTSRKPDDIPAFNTAVIELFSRARSRQSA